MGKCFFLREVQLGALLSGPTAQRPFALVEQDSELVYAPVNEETLPSLALRSPRPVASVKSLLFPVRELVAVYGEQTEPGLPEQQGVPGVIAGPRACEVEAIRILDQVFLEGDFQDPFYRARREAITLITTDCAEIQDSCHCNLVGGKPFAESGFDLNLSPIEDGYVVEVDSGKGQALLDGLGETLPQATPEQLTEREQMRTATVEKLQEQNRDYELPHPHQEVVAGARDSEAWREAVRTCVACTACTNICPTCHCFLLYDQLAAEGGERFERVKVWDSCLYADYSRMAGVGGVKPNPRAELRSRLENRILHKFQWFPENFGRLACVGCGRCIDACMGGEDLRKLLKEFSE